MPFVFVLTPTNFSCTTTYELCISPTMVFGPFVRVDTLANCPQNRSVPQQSRRIRLIG